MEVEAKPPTEAEQILSMNNERITVPELLFHPSDIGIPQAGVAEAIVQSIQSCHPDLHGMLYSNIIITGGNTLFPNYKERLERELRAMVPAEYELNVIMPKEYVE
jgi:actin-related protein 6